MAFISQKHHCSMFYCQDISRTSFLFKGHVIFFFSAEKRGSLLCPHLHNIITSSAVQISKLICLCFGDQKLFFYKNGIDYIVEPARWKPNLNKALTRIRVHYSGISLNKSGEGKFQLSVLCNLKN